VDVQRERRLAARELAHRPVHRLVALARGDLHLVPDGGGMCPRVRRGEPEPVEHALEHTPQLTQFADRVTDRRMDSRAQLDGARVRLGADAVAAV